MGSLRKRLVSIALSVVLVATLCPGLGLADTDTSSVPANNGANAIALEDDVAAEDAADAEAAASDAATATGTIARSLSATASSGVAYTTQATQGTVSGVSSLKPTLEQLRAAYRAIPAQPTSSNIFATANNLSKFTPAKLSSRTLSYSLAYLNFIRMSSGLSKIKFNSTLNDTAAQGALVLAKIGEGLDHYPAVPAGVSAAQAKRGRYSCQSSNLSLSNEGGDIMEYAIQGQMDEPGQSNLEDVGHRRWLLNPETSTMGIGVARGQFGWGNLTFAGYYTNIQVFTNSGSKFYEPSYGANEKNGSTNYDFVAWPASGTFPNNVFDVGIPWSVSLNPDRYQKPAASSVRVKVTRLSDNKSWTMTSANSTPSNENKYLIVENSGYGVSNCIIFNPGSNNIGKSTYTGSYRVDVTGIKTKAGASTSLSYVVNFTDVRTPISSCKVKLSPTSYTYNGKARKPSVTVTIGGTTLKNGTDYTVSYAKNVNAGTATVTIKGKGAYKGSTTAKFRIYCNWKRLWGRWAADTMKAIAKEFGRTNVAVVTTDASYKDALAASSLAGRYNGLVLMTKKGSLTKQTKEALRASKVNYVFLLGSTANVSRSVERQLRNVPGVKTVVRVAAKTPSQRAVAVAKKTSKQSDTVIIATQNGYQDALSIAPYSYATESPILYAEKSKSLSKQTTDYIKKAGYKKAIVVGGPIALPASIDKQLKKAGVKQVTRLAGANAYGTSETIARWATGTLKTGKSYNKYKGKLITTVRFQPSKKLGANKLAVTTGQNWKDALTGATLCGKNRSVLLLADAKTKKSDYKLAPAFCKANKGKISQAYVFGGTIAVQQKVWNALVASTR